MCSTYTSLDVLVVGMIMVIQLMLFSLLSIASEFIMISLIEKKPFFYLSYFVHEASLRERLTFLRSFQKFQERFISIW